MTFLTSFCRRLRRPASEPAIAYERRVFRVPTEPQAQSVPLSEPVR